MTAGQQTWDWANALAQEAEALAGIDLPRALRVFDAAAAKFGETQPALPNQPLVLLSWGQLLQAKAQALARSNLPAARQAWAESRAKYAAKMKLDPSGSDTPAEIGLTLLREYAALPASDHAANLALLDEAEKNLLAAEALAPGLGAYNLACVFAWRNRPKECVTWLDHARKFGRLPARELVLSDGYIGLVAKSEEFSQWLATAYSQQ